MFTQRQVALLDVPARPQRSAPRLGLSQHHQHPQRHGQHSSVPSYTYGNSQGYDDDAWLLQRALAGIDDLTGEHVGAAPDLDHFAVNVSNAQPHGEWQADDDANSGGGAGAGSRRPPRNTSVVDAPVPLSMGDIQEAIAQVDTQHSAVRTQAMNLLQRREYANAMQLMAQLDHLQYSATRLRSSFHDKKMMRLHDAVLRQHIQEFRVDKIDELREAIASAMDFYLAHEGGSRGLQRAAALGNAAGASAQNSTLEIAFSRLQQYEATLERFRQLLSHRMTQVLATAAAAPVQARLHAEHLLTTVRAAATQGLSEVQVFNCLDCRAAAIPDDLHRRILQILSRRRSARAPHSSPGAASPSHSAGDRAQRGVVSNNGGGSGRLARHRGQYNPRDERARVDGKHSDVDGQLRKNERNDARIGSGADDVNTVFAPPSSNALNLAAVVKGRAGRREQRRRLRSALAFMRHLCEVSVFRVRWNELGVKEKCLAT